MNTKEKINNIIDISSLKIKVLIILMIILSLLTIISIPTLMYANIYFLILSIVITLFYIPFFSIIFLKRIPLFFKIPWGSFTIFHSVMFFSSFPLKEAITNDIILLLGFIFGLISILFMIFCLKISPKRTPYGNEIYGKIISFRSFILKADKLKIQELAMQDPMYFYNMLPYAYALGLLNKWINNFNGVNLQLPKWHKNDGSIDPLSVGKYVKKIISATSNAMTFKPSRD